MIEIIPSCLLLHFFTQAIEQISHVIEFENVAEAKLDVEVFFDLCDYHHMR